MAIHAVAGGQTGGGGRAGGSGDPLAVHRRATRRGSWVIDPTHWNGLPDGTGRATTTAVEPAASCPGAEPVDPLAALLARNPAAGVAVARRPLASYAAAVGLPPCERAEELIR